MKVFSRQRVLKCSVVCLLLLCFCISCSASAAAKKKAASPVVRGTPAPAVQGLTSITLAFAGDVTLGSFPGMAAGMTFDAEVERQQYNYAYFLSKVRPIFASADLAIVNLEGPLTESMSGNTKKKFAFKGHPEYVKVLTAGEIDAVSLANNHAYDYFDKGLSDTKSYLQQAGIEYADEDGSAILEAKGIKVGLLAGYGWGAYDTDAYREELASELKSLKQKANLVVAFFHWGSEYVYYPDDVQKRMAHFCIDNGADLVIGSHPHVIQGIETYRGKNIVYSLGNFCFGGNFDPEDRDTFIYKQTFDFSGNSLVGQGKPIIIPCAISSVAERNNYQPIPLQGAEAKRVLGRLRVYSQGL